MTYTVRKSHVFIQTLLVVLIVGASFGLVQAGATNNDQMMIARVNGTPILLADLQRQLNDPQTVHRLELESGGKGSTDSHVEHLILQELIYRELFLQDASRRKIEITEQEVEQAVLALRRRFNDIDSFGVWMHDRGLDERSLFEVIRNGMLTNRVMAILVEDVQVSNNDIEEYYMAHKDGLIVGEEVRLRIIAVRNEKTAVDILAELRQGRDFSQLARQKSLGALGKQGGATGWVQTSTLPPELQKAAAMLQPGDVAGPLRKSTDEFLLVGLDERRPMQATSLKTAKPIIAQKLLAEKQQKAIRDWLTIKEQKAKTEVLLKPR